MKTISNRLMNMNFMKGKQNETPTPQAVFVGKKKNVVTNFKTRPFETNWLTNFAGQSFKSQHTRSQKLKGVVCAYNSRNQITKVDKSDQKVKFKFNNRNVYYF
eukprot:GAHX01000717.1.p1 GENE.GAHX01000717.1~~GAHX01000717.1.p1  ORF type:complete len:103 (-),score=11.36 GAHX01000717.1:90-398(-)